MCVCIFYQYMKTYIIYVWYTVIKYFIIINMIISIFFLLSQELLQSVTIVIQQYNNTVTFSNTFDNLWKSWRVCPVAYTINYNLYT